MVWWGSVVFWNGLGCGSGLRLSVISALEEGRVGGELFFKLYRLSFTAEAISAGQARSWYSDRHMSGSFLQHARSMPAVYMLKKVDGISIV